MALISKVRAEQDKKREQAAGTSGSTTGKTSSTTSSKNTAAKSGAQKTGTTTAKTTTKATGIIGAEAERQRTTAKTAAAKSTATKSGAQRTGTATAKTTTKATGIIGAEAERQRTTAKTVQKAEAVKRQTETKTQASTGRKLIDVMAEATPADSLLATTQFNPTWGQVGSYRKQGVLTASKAGDAYALKRDGTAQSKEQRRDEPQPSQQGNAWYDNPPPLLGTAGAVKQPTEAELSAMTESERIAAVQEADRSAREQEAALAAQELNQKANTFDPWSILKLPGAQNAGTPIVGQAALDSPYGLPARPDGITRAGFEAADAQSLPGAGALLSRQMVEPLRAAAQRVSAQKQARHASEVLAASQTDYSRTMRTTLDSEISTLRTTLEATEKAISQLAPVAAPTPAPAAAPMPTPTPSPGGTAATAATAAQDDPDQARREQLMTLRRQTQYQLYIAEDRLKNLPEEARAVAIDQGLIEGELTDEERVRYNLDIKSGMSGVGQFFNQLARTTGVSLKQTVDSTRQELAAVIVNGLARIAGKDSVFDWREDNQGAGALLDRAYSPTESLTDYEGSFDNEGWNTFQQLEAGAMKSVEQMATDMVVSAATGGAGKAAKLIGTTARLLNSALPQMGQAALQATAAGASVEQTNNAMLLDGAINGAIELGAMDMIWSNAGKLATRLRPSTLRNIASKLNRSWAGGIVDTGATLLKSFLSEGAEEAAEGVVSGAVAKAVYDTDRAWIGEGGVIDPEQMRADAQLGGAMGVVFTIVGGLLLPQGTTGHKMARELSRYMERGGVADVETIRRVSAQVEADTRLGELTPADVDNHTAIWQQNGLDAPESLAAWRAKAAQVEGSERTYRAQRDALSSLVDRIESGETDLTNEAAQQEYAQTLELYERARDEYALALSDNQTARDAYYAEEDELAWEIEGKSDSARERAQEIEGVLRDADVDEQALTQPEGQTAISMLNDALIAREGAAAALEEAHRAEVQAASPADQLSAQEVRVQSEGALTIAESNVQTAQEHLIETVRPRSPEELRARIEEGRARNREAGQYDARYDTLTREELASERAAQADILIRAQASRDAAHGNERARMTRRVNALNRHIAALDAEIALRDEVYGAPAEGTQNAPAVLETGTETGTETAPEAGTEAAPEAGTETAPEAQSGITVNGVALSDMTDGELAGSIQDAALMAGSPETTVRLAALRQERDARAAADSATGDRGRAARQERLAEIESRIADAPEWDESELDAQDRWLRRQSAQLENLIEQTEGSEQRMYTRQLERARAAQETVREEMLTRRDARRSATQELIDESEEELSRTQRIQADSARIAQNQQAGREAVDKLASERKNGLRVTDTIKLSDAAKIFENGAGMGEEGVDADTLLKDGQQRLSEWEDRRSRLQDSVSDLTEHLRTLEGIDSDTDSAEAGRIAQEINATRAALDKARAMLKRADSQIAYWTAHGAEGVEESLSSGRIAEPLMERIMGMVDGMRHGSQLKRHLNTPDRVFDDAFGRNSPVMRAIYIDPVKHAETERIKYQNSVIEDVKKLKLNQAESALVQRFGEGLLTPEQLLEEIDDGLAKRGRKLKGGDGEWHGDPDTAGSAAVGAAESGAKADEARRIAYAAKVIGGHYARMYDMVNDALTRNGHDRLGKIQNYFPHFDGEEGGALRRAMRKLGITSQNFELPADIYGLTETFSPGHQYSPFTQRRTGNATTYDALEGLSRYMDPMTCIAFHTDNIQRLRQLESAVRSGEKNGTLTPRPQSTGDFGKLAVWLHEYTNQLAGKKSNIFGDRDAEKLLGRKVYNAATKITNRRSASAVAYSISSAISNIVPVVEVAAKHPVAMTQAFGRWRMQLLNDGSALPESEFLTRRFGTDRLQDTFFSRLSDAANKPFELVDAMASNIVVRTCYEANLRAGMDPEGAMLSADSEAARLMADRSKGALPNLFGSRIFMTTLGQYQIEPLNQFMRLTQDVWRELSSDTTMTETGRGGEMQTHLGAAAYARGTGALALYAIVSWLTNWAWKKLTGHDILPDPIGAVQDAKSNYDENGDWFEALKAGTMSMIEGLPFVGMGRFGANVYSDLYTNVSDLGEALQATLTGSEKAAKAWNTVFWAGMSYVTGGGQFKKTYQGAGKLLQDGAFNSQGQLMYPVDASDTWTRIQAQVFGYSATKYARMYYDEGRQPLSNANTQKYLDLVESGMNPGEAYESLYAYQKADKLRGKLGEATKAGNTQEAARLEAQIQQLIADVDYATIIPSVSLDEVGKPYMDMLESAWRESGDNAFLPEYYYGEFTLNGVSRKFTPDAMEKLQPLYEQYLGNEMSQYSSKWGSMTYDERKKAYSDAKSAARKSAKEYAIKNGYTYVNKEDYDAAGFVAPEKAAGAQMQPGLTNPIGDAARVIQGEPVGTIEGGLSEDTRKLLTGEGVAAASPEEVIQAAGEIDAQAVQGGVELLTGGGSSGSGGRSGRGGKRKSSSRKRRSSGGGSSGSGESGAAASYWQQRARAALGAAFGGLDDGGAALGLSGDDLSMYQRLFNAYMTIYMWQGADGWEAADEAGKTAMLDEMAGRARTAAGEFYGKFYGSGMASYMTELKDK